MRKNKSENVSANDFNSARALLCFPLEPSSFKIAKRIFSPIIKEYSGKLISIVYQAYFPILRDIDIDSVIPILSMDLKKRHLPSGKLVTEVAKYDYKVAADLNPKFNKITSYLVQRCNAEMKIGFKSNSSVKIFNIEIYRREKEIIDYTYLNFKDLFLEVLI